MTYDYESKSATKNYSTFKVVFSSHLCICISDNLWLPTYLNQAIIFLKKVIDIYK